jgi:peptidoglycan/xylan/chitin deacetylase (PgdA/CDA1 family)
MINLQASVKRFAVGVGRRIIVPLRSPRVVVLCYHSVHPTNSFASATPDQFERHLAWLRQHCWLIRFTRVFEEARCPDPVRPAVALTFDDGYADNYEYAFPLLHQYSAPATFFVTAGFLEGDPAVAERFQTFRPSEPGPIHPLEWSQVQEMRRAGMEFGAHTYSHPNLARLDLAAVEVELRRSREILEDRLGEPIRLMAYPFGKPACHFSRQTMRVAADVGYEYAAAIACRPVSPAHSPFAVPRYFVTGDDVATLQDKILGAWDLLGLWHEHGGWLAQVHASASRLIDQRV